MSTDEDLESSETEEAKEAEGVGSKLSYEELHAELAKTRREAASRRVSAKEKDSELEEFRKWKEAQKSETDRLAERASAAETELAAMKRERMQLAVAQEAGLDLDLADRIRGESEAEMLKDAKTLAERAGKRQNSDLDPFAGRRGGPVRSGGQEPTSGEVFRNWMADQ